MKSTSESLVLCGHNDRCSFVRVISCDRQKNPSKVGFGRESGCLIRNSASWQHIRFVVAAFEHFNLKYPTRSWLVSARGREPELSTCSRYWSASTSRALVVGQRTCNPLAMSIAWIYRDSMSCTSNAVFLKEKSYGSIDSFEWEPSWDLGIVGVAANCASFGNFCR